MEDMENTKECTRCNKEKPLTEFSWKSKPLGLKAFECKECHRDTRKAYYEKNKGKEIERIKERKAEIKQYISSIKETLVCETCGESHIATLQFHHSDPSKKEISISRMHTHGWSVSRIQKELSKCKVLCANCHFKLHYDERT